MTTIKCSIESGEHICRYLKNGYCTRDEVEIEWERATPMNRLVVCSNVDRITNMMPEWKDFEQNRTEKYHGSEQTSDSVYADKQKGEKNENN